MANTYTEIIALANKNNMGLSNTIKRDYGIPLDYSSVQETYEAALAYAQTSTLAYIGQPISVGDTLYVVTDEANGYLKAVGTKPTGDNLSVVVAEDGKIAIKGFAAAADNTLPRKKADGSIEWVTIDAIVSGDGNEKTRLTVSDDSAIDIKTTYDESTDTYTYTLDVTLPAIPEYTLVKASTDGKTTYTLTKDGTAVGEAIEVPDAFDDTELNDKVATLESDVFDHEERLEDVETKVDTFFATVEQPDEIINTLAEIQKYIADDKTGAASMLASIEANAAEIDALSESVEMQIAEAVAASEQTASETFATKSNVEALNKRVDDAAVATEVNTALTAIEADIAELETAQDNVYTKDETYSRTAIDAIVAGIKGEYGETADSVAGDLAAHKQENIDKFASVDAAISANESDIATVQAAVEAINDETTGILATANKNAQDKLTELQDGIIAQHTADIAEANTKINTTSSDLIELVSRVDTTEDNIRTNTASIESIAASIDAQNNINQSLSDKDAELATLIQANSDEFANYDKSTVVDSKISKAVSDAIAGIDNSDILSAIANCESLIAAEESRAVAAEAEIAEQLGTRIQTNADELDRLNNVLANLIANDDEEALNSIKELATWITEHDTEIVPVVAANTAAIEQLEAELAARPIIAIATADVAGVVKASEEVAVDTDGKMSVTELSTDKLVQGMNTLVLNGGSAVVS